MLSLRLSKVVKKNKKTIKKTMSLSLFKRRGPEEPGGGRFKTPEITEAQIQEAIEGVRRVLEELIRLPVDQRSGNLLDSLGVAALNSLDLGRRIVPVEEETLRRQEMRFARPENYQELVTFLFIITKAIAYLRRYIEEKLNLKELKEKRWGGLDEGQRKYLQELENLLTELGLALEDYAQMGAETRTDFQVWFRSETIDPVGKKQATLSTPARGYNMRYTQLKDRLRPDPVTHQIFREQIIDSLINEISQQLENWENMIEALRQNLAVQEFLSPHLEALSLIPKMFEGIIKRFNSFISQFESTPSA
jgi:hypothetical protein